MQAGNAVVFVNVVNDLTLALAFGSVGRGRPARKPRTKGRKTITHTETFYRFNETNPVAGPGLSIFSEYDTISIQKYVLFVHPIPSVSDPSGKNIRRRRAT